MCFSRIDASVEDLTALASQFARPSDHAGTAAEVARDSSHQLQAGQAASSAPGAGVAAPGPIR